MKLKELWVESLPPVHIGRPDVAWDEVLVGHQEIKPKGSLAKCSRDVPGLSPFLEMVEEDARKLYGEDQDLIHNLRVRSGGFATSILGSMRTVLRRDFLKRQLPETFVNPRGVLHIDNIRQSEFPSYFVSSVEPTEHALGKFATAGYSRVFSGTFLTPFLLTIQSRRSMLYQPHPEEVVRLNHESVHRSPRRIVQPDVHHVFVSDVIEPWQ